MPCQQLFRAAPYPRQQRFIAREIAACLDPIVIGAADGPGEYSWNTDVEPLCGVRSPSTVSVPKLLPEKPLASPVRLVVSDPCFVSVPVPAITLVQVPSLS